MKEWTKEERYKILKSPDEIKDLHNKISKSNYRQHYHIQPVTGLLNDPNGFVWHDGMWHLFYQWCPWGAVHGLKHWYHIESKDLINWKNIGVAIRPDTFFDNKGAYSGSALPMDDSIYLYYTGNHRDENWTRIPYTCLVKLLPNGRVQKYSAPLFGPSDEYTDNQRDPKILFSEQTGKYYIMLGAQTKGQKGRVIFYESDNQNSGWKYKGELKVPGFEDFGGMWECPSIEHIGDRDILIFCPQHLHLEGHGTGTNHNGYIIGKMDYETLTFTPEGNFHVLDFGFDSYAAECAANQVDPNKATLIAWMGLPDASYPTDDEEWSGTLTLPRELTIRNRRLIQTPLPELKELRQDFVDPAKRTLPQSCEIEVNCKPQDFTLKLFTKEDGSDGFSITYNANTREITLDRSHMEKRFNIENGETRSRILDNPLSHLRIFIDSSSLEIFINDGDAVFTTRIFPTESEHHFTVTECNSIDIWTLTDSVVDDFVV